MRKVIALSIFMLLVNSVSLAKDAAPGRIISLSPGITEILFTLGLGEKVAAVTDYCIIPKGNKELPRIGCVLGANYEKILLLDPDLIIIPVDYDSDLIDFFKARGIDYLIVSMRTIDEILHSISQIGEATGRIIEAREIVSNIRKHIEDVKKRNEDRGAKSAMIVVERENESFDSLYIAGNKTFYSEILNILGVDNIYKKTDTTYPVISSEAVLTLNPDIIFEILPHLPDEMVEARIEQWSKLSKVNAVRDGRVYILNDDYVCIPGPRFILLLDDMEKIIDDFSKR